MEVYPAAAAPDCMQNVKNKQIKRIGFASGSPKQLGLYVHIPFCRSKCSYCDFYSIAGRDQLVGKYFAALNTHMMDSARTCVSHTVDSVYFGGGTPTHAGPAGLVDSLSTVKKVFRVSKDAEVTLETNPATVTKKDLKKLRKAGFNRISIGVQSALDRELEAVSRPHTFDDAVFTVKAAREAGFNNIGVDIMFGLPGQRSE